MSEYDGHIGVPPQPSLPNPELAEVILDRRAKPRDQEPGEHGTEPSPRIADPHLLGCHATDSGPRLHALIESVRVEQSDIR